MKRLSVLLVYPLLLTLAATALAEAPDAAWTQWRGPGRENHSPSKGLLENWKDQTPKLLWMSEGMGSGYASVSIAEGRIYTTGNLEGGQGVVAASVDGGKVLWTKLLTAKVPKHGYQGSRCTPTIDGDRLYVVTSDGAIHCLSASDGSVKWSREFADFDGRMMSGWGYSESPLVDGDWVLCTPGGKDAMIVALDKMTGKDVWRAAVPDLGGPKPGAGYSSIRISEGAGVKQYVQLIGAGVIGVRASDGKFLWGYSKVANGTANIPTPIVHGDYVFASSGYGTGSCLLKLSKDGGGVKAEEVYFLGGGTLQNHHGGIVKVGDYLYLGHKHNNGFPVCVEMKTGKIVWGGDFRGPGKGSAAVTYADGNLIFRYQGGTVALIGATPKEYQLKGTFKPAYQEGKTWAHPVVLGGKLYLREQDKLMCYDLRAATN